MAPRLQCLALVFFAAAATTGAVSLVRPREPTSPAPPSCPDRLFGFRVTASRNSTGHDNVKARLDQPQDANWNLDMAAEEQEATGAGETRRITTITLSAKAESKKGEEDKDCQRRLREKDARIADLEAKIAQLEAANGDVQAKNAKLEAANAALQAKNAQLEATNTALQAKIAQLEATNTALQAKIAQLEATTTALQAKIAQLEATNTALQAKIAQLEAANAALQTKIAQLEATNAALQAKNAQLVARIAELEAKLASQAESQRQFNDVLAAIRQGCPSIQEFVDCLLKNPTSAPCGTVPPPTAVTAKGPFITHTNKYIADVSEKLANAAYHRNVGQMRQLLAQGVDIYHRECTDQTVIHWACNNGLDDGVRLLLENGIPVDIFNLHRQTPLFMAAWQGQTGCAKVLVEAGAKLNVQDRNGDTALHYATAYGRHGVVKVLMDAGADPNVRDKHDRTPGERTHDAGIHAMLAARGK